MNGRTRGLSSRAACLVEMMIQRDWPIPPQEIISNGAPVFDGKYMYLRGEQHLYCIGETP